MQDSSIIRIGARSLLFAASILLVLMILTGMLSRVVPAGSFERETVDGIVQVVTGSYHTIPDQQLPVWRWFTAPAEVLWGPDGVTVISILLFMLLVAGAVTVMHSGGILAYLIERITTRFADNRDRMAAMIILVLMGFGSLLGSMEEVVVIVPLLTALAVRMGWDPLTGLGLSLGAIAFGFASAISNPFTVGVAQRIAQVPLFSGVLLRIGVFFIIYLLYTAYLLRSAHKISRAPSAVSELQESQANLSSGNSAAMGRSLRWFAACIGVMVISIIIASFISALSDLILIIVVLCFLAGGLGSGWISGMNLRAMGRSFISGVAGVAPGIILVLMAASVKHILASAGIMDTLLFWGAERIAQANPYMAALMIYGLVLVMNFFISSGSAKAFLIMPIIAPLADIAGLSRQTAILAFVFGDGFSNILYPTNALLLICLSVTGISYGRWFAWIWKIEAVILLVTLSILMAAVAIGYA